MRALERSFHGLSRSDPGRIRLRNVKIIRGNPIAYDLCEDRRATLSAAGETKDMYSTLNLVGDRLERQAKKHREKLKIERKREGKRASPRRLEDLAPEAPEGPRVIRVHTSPLKPMSVEEAILQVHGSEKEFLVFRNSVSQRVSVLYRRKDGNFGLIEPEP